MKINKSAMFCSQETQDEILLLIKFCQERGYNAQEAINTLKLCAEQIAEFALYAPLEGVCNEFERFKNDTLPPLTLADCWKGIGCTE